MNLSVSERVQLLGVGVSPIDLESAIGTIERWVSHDDRAQYICVATANSLVETRYDEVFRDIHTRASLVIPDGMPLVWLSWLLGYTQTGRVCGPDLMLRIFERSPLNGLRHYFYGGRPGVVRLLRESLERNYPGIAIVGAREADFEPGSFKYRTLSPIEDEALISQITSCRPDIVWIGLGSPAQERWMADHVSKLNAILIGVGAAFDFHAGIKRRAPHWMRRSGLEWAFRLGCEPRRLWRRYLVRNSQFVYFATRQLLGQRWDYFPNRRIGH